MERQGRRWDSGVVQRIQKARRAKNVKKYASHKRRKNLLGRLEKDAAPSVIVSSALGLPGAAAAAAEERTQRNDRFPDARKRGRMHSESNLANESSDALSDETEDRFTSLPNPKQPAESEHDGLIEQNRDSKQRHSARDKFVHSERAPVAGESSVQKNNDTAPLPNREHNDRRQRERRESGGGRNNNPFQRELRRRDNAREERERQARRWAHEAAVARKQKETSRKQRKQEVSGRHKTAGNNTLLTNARNQSKQYRSVTRRGQPRMKHRAQALLAEVSKKHGVGDNPGEDE